MTNSIALVEKMLPLIDEVYKSAAKSTILEAPAEFVRQTEDANTVKIAKLNLVGLGDYNKETGFPNGDVTLSWETHQFTNDRGRRFSVDRMDNVESFGLVASRMVGEYLRTHVIPEVDAYRFSKIASATGVVDVSGTLDGSSVKKAVDTAIVNLQEKEIDTERLVLFMTPTVAQLLSDNITRSTSNGERSIENRIETYNGIQIVRVPQTRFYKGITLNPGTTSSAGGYAKTVASGSGENAIPAGTDINFILMNRNAAYNVYKLNVAKIITPDENQGKDAWQFDFRMYHDTFVLENKAQGIYVHHKAAA